VYACIVCPEITQVENNIFFKPSVFGFKFIFVKSVVNHVFEFIKTNDFFSLCNLLSSELTCEFQFDFEP
jgi:hypothetical protein